MSHSVNIKGTKTEVANVGKDGDLLITEIPYPPIGVPNKLRPFVGNLTVGGDEVTTDLRVNGSVTAVDTFVGPPVDGDLYLTTANILIATPSVIALNRFGGINGGLTNGIEFFVETNNERFVFAKALKTNFAVIRIATLTTGIGGKGDAFQMSNINPANNDGYNPVIDLTRLSPRGIRLRADTLDKFGMTVRDDLTPMASFNILVTGYTRLLD